MRIGMAPTRHDRTAWRPAKVTLCILTYIPNQIGYYARRLEVFKTSLSSIFANTPSDQYDILVFDNGSCSEVVDFLRTLRDEGKIDWLMLSTHNVGAGNALVFMFRAAPGEIVAYSDDDVLFYPGWFEESLKILQTYPKVGMVSGRPLRGHFGYGNQYLANYLLQFPEVSQTCGHFIPDEWEREFATSINLEVDSFMNHNRQYQDILLEYRGVKAYSTATHFQFMANRNVILEGLQPDWDARLMSGPHIEIDKRIDALGYARLSTPERYVRHLGNVISPDDHAAIRELGITPFAPPWTPPGRLSQEVFRMVNGIKGRLATWAFMVRNLRPWWPSGF
jgi:glycosyltransferase involved in cell wall biosynthesis